MDNPCKIYYCYKATNQANGKVYIGFAGDPQQRWREHKRDAENGKGYAFHQAIRKHGWHNFLFEVLCCGKDKTAMLQYVEPQLIEQYQSRITQHGYNMHKKVLGAVSLPTRRPWTDREREVLSESCKRSHANPEVRKRISEGVRRSGTHKANTSLGRKKYFADGGTHGMAGRSHTVEARQKISTGHIGKKHSEETKQKMRESHKRRKEG